MIKITKPTCKKLTILILICIGILFLLLALTTNKPNTKQPKKKIAIDFVQPTSRLKYSQISFAPTITPKLQPLTEKAISQNTATPTQNPTPLPTQSLTTYQVNLSINGSASFNVNVSKDANQCDVLQNALSQGKISSLNMRYDTTFQTYGVYQINGIGQGNQIFWVYKVNGTSAPKGCSFIPVNQNDTIEWKYIGS